MKHVKYVFLSCIALVGLFIPATMALAAITSDRDLPDSLVRPDDMLEVTVTFTAPSGGINAIGLSDYAPSGWTVAVDPDLCSPAPFGSLASGNRADYIWDGPYDAGQEFSATYQVNVPPNTVPGVYDFEGVIEYYLAGDGPYVDSIGGQLQVTVISDIPGGGGLSEPIADAGGPYTGTIDLPVVFDGTGSSDPDGLIVTYDWDFGDGVTGSGVTQSHAYVDPGIYTLTLTVTDNNGLTDSATSIVTIESQTLKSEKTQSDNNSSPSDVQDIPEDSNNKDTTYESIESNGIQSNPSKTEENNINKSNSTDNTGGDTNWWIVIGIVIGSLIVLFLLVKLVLSLRRY